MSVELTLMQFVEEHATREEFNRYMEVSGNEAPAGLWYFGVDAYRESHPGYCERYDLEQIFAEILRQQIAERAYTAQGRLNGALQPIEIDRGIWPEVRISRLENRLPRT